MPTLVQMARNNVVSHKSDKKPGFRINWLKFILALILASATAYVMHLRDVHHNLYTGWSLASIIFIVVGSGVVYTLLEFSRREGGWLPVLGAFFLGAVLMATFIGLWHYSHVGWGAVALGILTFAVIGGCIVGISVTRWWPHGRASRNRDEL